MNILGSNKEINEVATVRLGAIFSTILILLSLSIFPASAQDSGNIPDGIETTGEGAQWTLPGAGAGQLVVNPGDGSLWTFLHQSGNLVSLDTMDGSVLLDIPLTINPTTLTFTPDGSIAFLAGEPLDDQVIDTGIVQAIDPADGDILGEIELDGACNAVYALDNETVYAACGMQYAYEGTIFKLMWDAETQAFNIDVSATCGKIPWAIAEYNGNLYVTDLELQWTAQPDGTMGPPYGAWVWAYEAGSLTFVDRSWVGINPSRLAVVEGGVLAACSGSKQVEGILMEPSLALITSPGESQSIYIGTAGASDLAISPDGGFAAVSLADWGPPAEWSVTASIQNINPGSFPEAKRWTYTGDLAYVTFENGEARTIRTQIVQDSFIRSVAISNDGTRIFALQGEPEMIIVIPVERITGSN